MKAIKDRLLIVVPLLFACSAQTHLVPLGKGNLSVDGSLGGPVVSAFNTRIFIPYATTGLAYGAADRLDVNGRLHLLPLPYGIFGFDAGASWYPELPGAAVPTIGLHPQLLVLVSMKPNVKERFKIYPVISGSAAWPVKNGLFYLGSDLCISLQQPDYDQDAEAAIVSPFWGYRWKIGARWHLYTELKWHGANIRSDRLAVDYQSLGHYGAVTTLFSIQRSF